MPLDVPKRAIQTLSDPKSPTELIRFLEDQLAKVQHCYVGSGAPGFVAPIGSTYQRRDGGAGTSFYVNEDGTALGWVAK